MSRVFITGASDGLGLAAVTLLLRQGHEVVGHARNIGRAADLRHAAPGMADAAVGDLSSAAETRSVANQVNALGRFNAVIHNAGVATARIARSPRSMVMPMCWPSTCSPRTCSRRSSSALTGSST